MLILGIETSCDETALALIEVENDAKGHKCRVIQSLVHSQADLHSAYGGVFPTLAKREHGKNLFPLLHKILIESSDALRTISHANNKPVKTLTDTEFNSLTKKFMDEFKDQNPDLEQSLNDAKFLKEIPCIDKIAVTEGPGLEPALWVGINFARIISAMWNIPIVPVNHMEGHVVGSLLETDKAYGTWQHLKPIHFPALALLISGGHTELVEVTNHIQGESSETSKLHLKYKIIGQTKDDAVGEAFDKAARLLGLPYPGGPHLSGLATIARDEDIDSPIRLPRPMIHSKDLDFSFSGLKTAVLYAIRDHVKPDGSIEDRWKKGLCREFEDAVTETLDTKMRGAIEAIDAKTLIIGGGVSANEMLRKRFTKTAAEFGIPLYMPTKHISGDNALMIAMAGAINHGNSSKPLKADGTKRL